MGKGRLGLAAVLLKEPRLRNARIYSKAIQTLFPDVPVSLIENSDEVRAFKVGDSEVYIPIMPPFPWEELKPLTTTAWHWKESGRLLRANKAHILVTLRLGPQDPVERAMLLSKATAAVLLAQESLGVFWNGPAISPTKRFFRSVKAAIKGGRYPVLSWVNCTIIKEESGVCFVTQGMDELGHLEMEVLADHGDRSLVKYALSMCDNVLKQGPILPSGKIKGRTAGDKFPVVLRPWRLDPVKQAIQIDMRKSARSPMSVLGRLFGK